MDLLTTTPRTPITLRRFLDEMEATLRLHPWLADAPLRNHKRVEDVNGDLISEGPEAITNVSAETSASTHYILLK